MRMYRVKCASRVYRVSAINAEAAEAAVVEGINNARIERAMQRNPALTAREVVDQGFAFTLSLADVEWSEELQDWE